MFNGFIPVVAIQLAAVVVDDAVTLFATRVVDQMVLGDADAPQVDRSYWTAKADMTIPDGLVGMPQVLDPDWDPNYVSSYIGTAHNGLADNVIAFHPRRKHMLVEVRAPQDDAFLEELEAAGVDVARYSRYGKYELRIQPSDIDGHGDLLRRLVRMAHMNAGR